ncbi:hypothetical protein FPZ12_020545 [Amycolatopsis acidicola]|uniref:Histone protein n=1 Tax=Amycolatopsis acidicola TaxID=2596893 RepID=A0A5N0V359_9PSEU|nr:hypothetical protein [Amycolatopsis acidicola]KAA9159298.1 hypothetical protein FPZ12_020545 [Amycolatopsis acidicola]
MKAGARVALAVGAGYALGRTKKMRLALMIAAAGATGKANLSPGKLLQSGLSQLGSSPELSRITDLARDELMGAAKAAAVTAASSRIESLSDRLQEGGPLRTKKRDAEQDSDEGEDAEEYAEEEQPAEAEPEEEEEEPPRRRKPARGGGRRRAAAESEEESEESEEPEEPEEESPPPRARRSRSSSGRTPVRRARR